MRLAIALSGRLYNNDNRFRRTAGSQWLGLDLFKEVIAGSEAIQILIPQTDVAIELGGEDAKITYFREDLNSG